MPHYFFYNFQFALSEGTTTNNTPSFLEPPTNHQAAITSIAIRGGIIGGRKPFHHHERWMRSKGGSCMKTKIAYAFRFF